MRRIAGAVWSIRYDNDKRAVAGKEIDHLFLAPELDRLANRMNGDREHHGNEDGALAELEAPETQLEDKSVNRVCPMRPPADERLSDYGALEKVSCPIHSRSTQR
jgi:hypothetical protein